MTNLKWADVAHYHANSQILVQCFRGDKVKLGKLIGVDRKSGVYLLFGYDQPSKKQSAGWVSLEWCSPILRHRDDMTEEEARELFAILKESQWGLDWPSCKQWFVEWLADSPHVEISAIAFHWLISRGFDVFGLIEAGEAIRKEVGND